MVITQLVDAQTGVVSVGDSRERRGYTGGV